MQELVELPQGGKPPGLGGRGETPRGEIADEGTDVGGLRTAQCGSQPGKHHGGVIQIAPIGIERIDCRAALGAHHLEECFGMGGAEIAHRVGQPRLVVESVGRNADGHVTLHRFDINDQGKHGAVNKPGKHGAQD